MSKSEGRRVASSMADTTLDLGAQATAGGSESTVQSMNESEETTGESEGTVKESSTFAFGSPVTKANVVRAGKAGHTAQQQLASRGSSRFVEQRQTPHPRPRPSAL